MDMLYTSEHGCNGQSLCHAAQVPGDAVTPSGDDPRVVRTRSAVHEAGRELLVESGPAAVTHAAIASAARLSRTTLYKYWPTRLDLVYEICEAARPHPAIRPHGDVRLDLIRLATEVAHELTERDIRKIIASMVAQSQWDDDAREIQQAMIGLGISDLTAILDAAVETGQLPVGIDPDRAANRLLGPLFFATMVNDVDVGSAEIESIVDDWLESVRHHAPAAAGTSGRAT